MTYGWKSKLWAIEEIWKFFIIDGFPVKFSFPPQGTFSEELCTRQEICEASNFEIGKIVELSKLCTWKKGFFKEQLST